MSQRVRIGIDPLLTDGLSKVRGKGGKEGRRYRNETGEGRWVETVGRENGHDDDRKRKLAKKK